MWNTQLITCGCSSWAAAKCHPMKVACCEIHQVSMLIDQRSVNAVVQDPTGYKYELIQRPEHKGDRILHVRRLLSRP